MKKKLLILGVFLLAACGGNNNTSILSSISEEEFSSSLSSIEVSEEFSSLEEISSALVSSEEESFFSEEISSEDNTILEIEDYIQYMMDETDGYVPCWSAEGFKGRWNYIDGVMLTSLLNLYESRLDDKYKDFVIKFVNYYIDKNGNFKNLVTSYSAGYQDNALDTICESRILYPLNDLSTDGRYLKGVDKTFAHIKKHSRTSEGSFYHKETYVNQVWLDGLYMALPFYTMYANNNPEATITVNGTKMSLYDDILLQFQNVRNHMFDEEKGLYYHGYDVSRVESWANKETGCSASFWLRSIGWYMMALVDVIDLLEEGDMKTYLSNLLVEAVEGIMKYQDESKMFYQVVDQGDRAGNYLETSGSSMISYVLLKGARIGVLDKEYRNLGKEVFLAIKDNKFRIENGKYYLDSICVSAGLGGHRDGSYEYYISEAVGSNDAKGVGPFIMAYSELVR